eukprot:TRINITY_DN40687_c0_g3_i1.p1 TRINITY_DN40687_c0_g3~~TRINITY_DN40687_c0_g3_i1.p1  ORF type:complete len:245 (-),score=33.65 TRINITY_DN40687_c0_g3_i1:200-934(-)
MAAASGAQPLGSARIMPNTEDEWASMVRAANNAPPMTAPELQRTEPGYIRQGAALRSRAVDNLTGRPLTAGVPLSTLNVDTFASTTDRMAARALLSPLHPATSPVFNYSRKRQAYGTAAPTASPVRHQPQRSGSEWVEEARTNWYKNFSANCEKEAYKSTIETASPRPIGASGPFCHTEAGDADGWRWQPWRGWTKASRNLHENRMRQSWQAEARHRWAKQLQESEWRPKPLAILPPEQEAATC